MFSKVNHLYVASTIDSEHAKVSSVFDLTFKEILHNNSTIECANGNVILRYQPHLGHYLERHINE